MDTDYVSYEMAMGRAERTATVGEGADGERWVNPSVVEARQTWIDGCGRLSDQSGRVVAINDGRFAVFADGNCATVDYMTDAARGWRCVGFQLPDGRRVMVGDRFKRTGEFAMQVYVVVAIAHGGWATLEASSVSISRDVRQLLESMEWERVHADTEPRRARATADASPAEGPTPALQTFTALISFVASLPYPSPDYYRREWARLRRLCTRVAQAPALGMVARRRLAAALGAMCEAVEQAPMRLSPAQERELWYEVSALMGWLAIVAEETGEITEERERMGIDTVEERVRGIVEAVKDGRRVR